MTQNDIIREHVRLARRASHHDAKRSTFSELLRKLFNIKLEELLPGVEVKLGSKIYGVKGSVDLLFSNVVFEFKTNLRDELSDAIENKLPKYLQALHEVNPESKHIGIATDAVIFKAYVPLIKGDRVARLEFVSELNLEKATTEQATLWLDSFLFSNPAIEPTADDIKWRFGPSSPTYALSIQELRSLWDVVKDFRDANLRFDLWAKHMEMVYGGRPNYEAFIDQTYLVTLVKLILYLKLGGSTVIKKPEIEEVFSGEFFKKWGILNLIEEDFFSWPSIYPKIREASVILASRLVKELLRYDMKRVDEDLFKEIYQEIVSRSERHRIGEYYTPEWLCELTLRKSLEEWKKNHKGIPRIIDPACGSGTFLTNSIRLLREELTAQGVSSDEANKQIFGNVVGIDINPLAVVIARANYIIMFGEELPSLHVTIPVYVADSINLPFESRDVINGEKVYMAEASKYKLHIPVRVASDRAILGKVLQGMGEALKVYRSRSSMKASHATLKRWADGVSPEELKILTFTFETLVKLVQEGKDSIWLFWLNNIHAPVALRETPFDLVVGNPPWVAMRYFENKDYQEKLKESVFNYALLDKGETELFTHMEIATLFFRKSSELYLNKTGVIGFVMPRSVLTGAFHHAKFKQFTNPLMKLVKVLDFEGVSPLFNVPSCVLICVKNKKTEYPVLASEYSGVLNLKNERLATAVKKFKISDYKYEPPTIPTKRSPYHDKIREGATIVPRACWFIEFDVPPTGWVDAKSPVVKTASNLQKKPPWTNVKLQGNVENDFIYVTLLGGDVVRFGYTKIRPVVLPIKPSNGKLVTLDVKELMNEGYTGITEWLEGAQQIWEKMRTEKAQSRFPRILNRIDYNGLLSIQNPKGKYVVIYNASGTNLVSCVVNKLDLPKLVISKTSMNPAGFVVESKTYFYESDDEDEVHYLSAVLNSNVINESIKPFQTKGLLGERDIHRRPFMFNIPKFNRNDSLHVRLVELSKICHTKVNLLNLKDKNSASARKEATKVVEKELEEIDDIVKKNRSATNSIGS